MTDVEQMATFVTQASYAGLSASARQALKIRVLDVLGCAIGALPAEPMGMLRGLMQEFGEGGRCTQIGGSKLAPDRAAFYNSALGRYLDFNDSYLAPGETCHPSDNVGAVLAAADFAGAQGREFLTALAVAYQVQCRLSDVAPVRAKGFDHTTQLAYSVAAGVSKALGLDASQTANALAISGTAFNALRVTRTGPLSHWKGLAAANTAFGCTHGTFLARQGITGPPEVFEGNKGFMDAIAGHFEIDWGREDLERVTHTIVKKYNAEIHSQSALEGILEMKQEHAFEADDVERIRLDIFDVAYHIIGGGEEGDKTVVRTKEEADHSLPYMLAVAILDSEVTPDQYRPERIQRQDVQSLLRQVSIRPEPAYSARFPEEMPCRLTISLGDGRELTQEKRDYEGFHTRPMGWEGAVRKFQRLSQGHADAALQDQIADVVGNLENVPIDRLMKLLVKVLPYKTDSATHRF
jgi:2-methylcitrate dehydratase